jgi:hypothetical protein
MTEVDAFNAHSPMLLPLTSCLAQNGSIPQCHRAKNAPNKIFSTFIFSPSKLLMLAFYGVVKHDHNISSLCLPAVYASKSLGVSMLLSR